MTAIIAFFAGAFLGTFFVGLFNKRRPTAREAARQAYYSMIAMGISQSTAELARQDIENRLADLWSVEE